MHNVVIKTLAAMFQFTPRDRCAPTTEQEVLDILDRHSQGKIRVAGALHAWSPVVAVDEVLLDMRNFDSVEVEREADGTVWAVIGGGCQIKHLLDKLHAQCEATLPSVGLITEQTIAGAISTATHGSGKPSLSHFIDEVRAAAYDPHTHKARIYIFNQGPELRAARCALGCMGVILSVRIRCVCRYDVVEMAVAADSLEAALASENQFPLQQFYLLPHGWCYLVQRRAPVEYSLKRGWRAKLYRAYWLFGIDVSLHVIIKAMVSGLKSRRLTRFFYRHILSRLVIKNVPFVDHADLTLTMEHELFKHLEIEIFVPARWLPEAARFVRAVLEVFDDTQTRGPVLEAKEAAALVRIGMHSELMENRGTFTHHYPITFRRVLPDDTLISMTSSATEPYYAISFITYVEPRDTFFVMASFLARSMTTLFDARLHWGKYFPLRNADIDHLYPHLAEFRAICRQVDPDGVFQNEFTQWVLFAQ